MQQIAIRPHVDLVCRSGFSEWYFFVQWGRKLEFDLSELHRFQSFGENDSKYMSVAL